MPIALTEKYLSLIHISLDLDGIGIVDDPVADGVGQSVVVQILVPLAGVILGTEDGGGLSLIHI